jgi:hypothetical protein
MSYSNVIRCAASLLGAVIAAQSMAATPDELVCHDYPRPGSHMMMHVCVTQAEWNAMLGRDAALQRAASASGVQGASAAWANNAPSVNTSASTSFQRY